ncbi:MAG: hypothetical protein ACREQZ_09960 [Woeseiaceae bacterium]
MKASTVRLLQAASALAGGRKALADHLGISETLLSKFMADSLELPDPLLLRAVDIILEDRQSRLSAGSELALPSPQGSMRD